MTTTTAPLPRTASRIIDTAEGVELDGVRAEIRWTGDRSFEVLAPRRFVSCPTDGSEPVRSTKLQVVGRLGWYVRDGRAHIGGTLDDIERAFANIAEGRDALRPRRGSRSGTYPGRDRGGRFVSDQNS